MSDRVTAITNLGVVAFLNARPLIEGDPGFTWNPGTADIEIQATEMRYLEAYEKHPVRTQWRYFWKAFYNIVFKKARSA